MSGDVGERLATGEPAVGTVETYVAACRALGRPVAGVTVAGIRDAYAAEAGMRLHTLDADSAALARLAHAAEEGLSVEREALDVLRRAWQGRSGDAAAESVERHWVDGAGVAGALRDAAEVMRSLRTDLGSLVDQKVAAAVEVDSRRAAQHPGWLAEARAVLEGVADDVAVEVVARQIGPYVDGDVAADLMPAMRAGTDSVAAAYDGALARLSERPTNRFDSPAPNLGEWGQPGDRVSAESAPPQVPVPAAAAPWAPSAGPSPWSAGLPAGFPAGLSNFGAQSGLGGFGGTLPSMVGQIADMLGGYADPLDPVRRSRGNPLRSALDDKPDAKESELQQDKEPEQQQDDANDEKKPIGGVPVPGTERGPATEPVLADPAIQPQVTEAPDSAPPVQMATTQTPPTEPPAAAPVPVLPTVPRRAAPLAAEVPDPVAPVSPSTGAAADSQKTPCAIAADELPQVGQ